MNNLFSKFIIAVLIFVAILGILNTVSPSFKQPEQIALSQLAQEIKEGQIESLQIKSDSIIDITKKDGTKQTTSKEAETSTVEVMTNLGVTDEQLGAILINVNNEKGLGKTVIDWLPIVIPFILVLVVLFFFMKQLQGANSKAMSFGQAGARMVDSKGKNKVTFKEVAGNKEAKEELEEVVEFLKNPEKFTSLGAKIPKGVLLMGGPGTGKTMMAKAVAGEANVPFFSISGSEFVEMFVGVGASRVRDLFKTAKKASPCIVFIDEIDAVGRQRGAGVGGSHDEREQTLNQILVEMDGMETKDNVIVIAATNRPDILDSALLRPGRFDRRVTIDMPDLNAREEILKVHTKEKPMAKDVNMREVAERTVGFSGADLANLLNEAAILAARENKKQISHLQILESIEKVILGPARKSHVITLREKEITAHHEAGHAIVAHFLPNTDPVHKVSVISRGRAGGYTLKLPTEDKNLHTRQEFIEDIAVMLGGQTAEDVAFKDITTGASSDLRKATDLAKAMIMDYGMNERLGPRTFGDHQEMVFMGKEISSSKDYSEKIAEIIDEEVGKLIKEGQQTARRIIIAQKEQMEKVVKELMEKETIEREEFLAICGPRPKRVM